jgi:hypothetical protein
MDMKKILQAIDAGSSKPAEGSSDMKKFVQIVNEGANPHKVSLPVQMAMNHYQEPKVKKESALRKYFKEAEEVVNQQQTERKQHLQMYAQRIAQKVLENKRTDEGVWDSVKSFGKDALGLNSPEDIAAKDPNGQMAQLLQLRAKYKGTQFEKQIEDRIKNLQFRINGGHGAPMGADGMPKAVVPPEEFSKQNPSFKESSDKQKVVTEGSAHRYNVVKWYEKWNDQKKLVKWLRKEAGLPNDDDIYFDDADLVYGDKTIVRDALVDPKLKFIDLLNAVAQATGGKTKQQSQGIYREQGVTEEKTGKQKGVDGKACWDGYKRMGTKKKGGKTVDNCVPTGKK